MNQDLLPDHPQAHGAQTLGIIGMVLSFVGLGILAPVALYRALRVRREIKARPGLYRTNGPAQVAMITSIIGTVVFVLATILIAIVLPSLFQNA